MAALYGWLIYDHDSRRITRTANRVISSCVKTRKGQVEVFLSKAGDCTVTLKTLPSGRTRDVWSGNIDTPWPEEGDLRPTVKIQARAGMAEVVECPYWIKVEIEDLDIEGSV